ncbi:class I SAM-dependent methyltransferase [Pseudomonas sp. SO81]|uniref:class I SAM-dependent methyltransferase n=1 Tax=Pseudomonas sp. SO81 TaxID=2983246 RepID=UPI0025A4BDD1|nr:class I SAM-dependent methyltransferase [Pseudomonas sp. SO81]WJN57840.1 putative methyltransferase [Pseudomonas sp. SO81]
MNSSAIALLQQHLDQAFACLPDEARRLFHGRGRQWPGLEHLTADWLQGVLLVALFREPDAQPLAELKDMLLQFAASPAWARSGARHLLLQHRYQADSATEYLVGEAIEGGEIEEGGLRYLLDFGRKQNSGLFLDMRLGRQWVREQAGGQRVLNLFAYTCGFSVAAIAGGAERVVNLDMSRPALSRGRDNHRLNGHDLARVSFLGHDLFNSWGKLRKDGPFELIIVDPPSFQKGSFVLTRDYAKIMRRLPDMLTPGGRVLACVNDPAIAPAFLIGEMAREAPQLRFVERLANPPEFADSDPDAGLKVLLFTAD